MTKRLRIETLEDRRVLSTVTVSNALDVVNGDTLGLDLLVASDGGDGISLREAILAANNTVGADEILFDAALAGQTITLGGSQLSISDTLTIDATALTDNVTLDANQLSRIFILEVPGAAPETFDTTLAGLTLTGGKTTFNLERGGAILSISTGTLTLEESEVRGNKTEGERAGGGGIRVAGDVVLNNSTVSGNSTLGNFSRGGGIEAIGSVTLNQSTLSGNIIQGASTDGAGIRATGPITLIQSTVTNNQATFATATGGGIWNNNDPILISNSIVAGNSAGGSNADLRPGNGTLTVDHSLIGNTFDLSSVQIQSINTGVGNLLNVAPLLDPLADNGGPTQTHALQTGSPALNAGGTTTLSFDQRGTPFARLFGAAVDIGAYESGVITVVESADFDGDSDIDGADFLAWQRGFGKPDAGTLDGDANNDSDVDNLDLGIWQQQFGLPTPLSALAATTTSTVTASTTLAIEAADFAILGLQWPALTGADQEELASEEEQSLPEVENISATKHSPTSANLQKSDDSLGVDQFFEAQGSNSEANESLDIRWTVYE